jgi:hypothetical protein
VASAHPGGVDSDSLVDRVDRDLQARDQPGRFAFLPRPRRMHERIRERVRRDAQIRWHGSGRLPPVAERP